jgi:hypothetical protein
MLCSFIMIFCHLCGAAAAPCEFVSMLSWKSVFAILTLLNLLCLDVPKLVHLSSLAGDNALGELNCTTNGRAPGNSVLCGLAGDLDEADARVLRATVVLAVAEVTEPGLERGRVVLLDARAVGLDGSGAGDAGPLAGVVEESKVDLGVLLEIVGLAGLGVGVEDEVDAVVLLRCWVSECPTISEGVWERTLAATAMHLLARRPS